MIFSFGLFCNSTEDQTNYYRTHCLKEVELLKTKGRR